VTENEGVFSGTDTLGQKYHASCAVIASGRTPRRLKVPNALFKGVHFCSLCDGPLYRNKNATLAVIGKDNAAGQHALTLSRIAEKVFLVSRTKDFQMDTVLTSRIQAQNNIELLPGTEVIDYSGNGTVNGIEVRDQEGEKKEIAVDGIFLAVGWQINTKMVHLDVDKTPAGYLKTDTKLMTSCAGLFAAGDVRASDMYQVLTACADGARAAKFCFEYLDEQGHFKKNS
jgi:thioredoxin reductase (NADPH)